MRHASVAVLVALMIWACALCASAGAADSARQQMVDRINAVRTASGLPALRASSGLDRSAGAFSRVLLRRGLLAHRPLVSTTRSYRRAGDALAMHPSRRARVAATLRGWLRSPAHRELVMTSSMNLLGIGHASGRPRGRARTVWVLQVARG